MYIFIFSFFFLCFLSLRYKVGTPDPGGVFSSISIGVRFLGGRCSGLDLQGCVYCAMGDMACSDLEPAAYRFIVILSR